MEKLKLYGKKDEKKEEFLGVIYVNEKKEIVIDIKEPEIKKDIAREISKEIQEYGGILWLKDVIKTARDWKKYREELTQTAKKILGEDFEKYVKETEKILDILKLHEKACVKVEKEKAEIEKKFKKKIEELIKEKEIKKVLDLFKKQDEEDLVEKEKAEIEKKFKKKTEEVAKTIEEFRKKTERRGLSWLWVVLIVGPERKRKHGELRIRSTGFSCEKPGDPFFLDAVSWHLCQNYQNLEKKYGGYTLTKLPIIDDKN